MSEKRYYYLKLEEEFFRNKVIKALRKLPAGSDLVICYMKMQLHYIKKEGFIEFDGIYNSIEEEIAEEIDEAPNSVRMTIQALKNWNYIEELDNNNLYLNEMQERVGSKSDVAVRVARHRQKKLEIENKQKMLQCNSGVTKSNAIQDIEIDIEIDKEKKREDKEKELEREREQQFDAEVSSKSSTIFITLPSLNKKPFHIYEEDIEKYKELYPALDIKQELRNMFGWLDANPANKKKNVKAFITRWMSRNQDKAPKVVYKEKETTKKEVTEEVEKQVDEKASKEDLKAMDDLIKILEGEKASKEDLKAMDELIEAWGDE